MSPERDPSNDFAVQSAFMMKALVTGGEMGCLMLVIVLVAVFGGLWVDNLLGTKPVITILLVLISVPISLGSSIWIAMRTIKNSAPASSMGNQKTSPTEGENNE
jgi:hypothetical protein